MIVDDDDTQRDIFFYDIFEKIKINVQIDVKTKKLHDRMQFRQNL